MKKIISIGATIIVVVAGMFFWLTSDSNVVAKKNNAKDGFENINNFKPGTYKAEYDKPDFRGWKAFFVMDIAENGSVKNIQYDYLRSDGRMKTKDAKYNDAMIAQNGVGPMQYVPRLAKSLLVFGNPDEIDNITGATNSCRDFKLFAKKVFQAAKEGATTTIVLPQPEASTPQ